MVEQSVQTIVRAATLRQMLQIKLSFSPNHNILKLGQPVPALTVQHQTPVRVATGVPVFKSLVLIDLEEGPQQKQESNPGLPLSWRTPYCWAIEAAPTPVKRIVL